MSLTQVDQSVANQTAIIKRRLALEARIRGGANWFFLIAALSIINSIIYVAGGRLTFLFGLGLTQVIDGLCYAIAREVSPDVGIFVRFIGLVADLAVAGVFAVAGILARKRFRWAVISGTVLYGLDGLICLLAASWLGLGLHIFVTFVLIAYLKSMNNLNQLEANGMTDAMRASLASRQEAQETTQQKTGKRAILYLFIIVMFACVVFGLAWFVATNFVH